MRKTERLDQILIRLGYVTPSQVEQAVQRQAAQGGRIGQNLIDLKALTEAQLFDALVEQFRVPTIAVDEKTVDRALLERMPAEALESGLIVPVSWNQEQQVLSVAVANPSNEEGIASVARAFGARKVRVSLAPEGVLADLIMRLRGGESPAVGDDGVRLVALPELFEPSEQEAESPVPPVEGLRADRYVVMVASGPSRKNFLPAVMRAEGFELVVVDGPEEVRDALEVDPETVLVSRDMEERWHSWIAKGVIHPPACEVNVFDSVADVLLDTPAPYSAVAQSVRASAQAIAEARAIAAGVNPPYTLMSTDLDLLGERVGLGRLARDGMHIGLHLLSPVDTGSSIDPFRSFAATIELAHRIRFPWPVDRMLKVTLGLYLDRAEASSESSVDEVMLAAQVLSLVWFRHNLAEAPSEPPAGHEPEVERDLEAETRGALRSLAGRFAPLEVIESYVELLAERERGERVARRVLLIGGERLSRAVVPALGRVGIEASLVANGVEAQANIEAVDPQAIIIDHQAVGTEVERVCRVMSMDQAIVFVLTDDSDPSLVLNLLDVGVDDVFAPPHDFDLMAARVLRGIRARDAAPTAVAPQGDFAARFEAFSFIDLAQMLANGHKSVRVDLRSGAGEEAVMFFEKGRPVHAECGALTGPQAVYYVISWEDEGDFAVNDEVTFPTPNLAESIESLLMEGVRLLDESRA